jgi:hypothetical protein
MINRAHDLALTKHDAALLRLPRSDQVAYDHQPRRNADASLQGYGGLERANRRDQFKPRTYRALGVVFMCLRITEVDKHTVAHVFGDEATEPAHGLGYAFLIGRNNLAQILRVHAGGQRCRADEVAEHDRYLTAFCSVMRLRLYWRGGFGRCRSRKLADGREYYPPMPEQDPDIFKVLIGQMGQCRDVNSILSKALRILGHAELFEPIRNLLHRGGTPDCRASSARIGKFIRQTGNAVGSIFLASGRVRALARRQELWIPLSALARAA